MVKFGVDKEQQNEQRKVDNLGRKKDTGIHWQDRGDNVIFHIGAQGERQILTKQQFYSQFPKEPKHGIKDKKWAAYLDKNNKACAEFRKKYS